MPSYAARKGRPARARATSQTRVWTDQVEKLQWLFKLRGIIASDFIGALIEEPLNAEYASVKSMVDRLTRERAKRTSDDDADPPVVNELLGNDER